MLLNASFDYPNVYSTLCDDYTTMFEATESMLDSGIADPVYIYNSISYSGRKKLNGFKDALKKHGISDIETESTNTTEIPSSLTKLLTLWIRLQKRPLLFME